MQLWYVCVTPPTCIYTLQTYFMSKSIAYCCIGDAIDLAGDTFGLVSCFQERKTLFRINCHQGKLYYLLLNCWLLAGPRWNSFSFPNSFYVHALLLYFYTFTCLQTPESITFWILLGSWPQ